MKDKNNKQISKQSKIIVLHDYLIKREPKKLMSNLKLLQLTDEYFRSILNKFIKDTWNSPQKT